MQSCSCTYSPWQRAQGPFGCPPFLRSLGSPSALGLSAFTFPLSAMEILWLLSNRETKA